jgi:hypothetical protein
VAKLAVLHHEEGVRLNPDCLVALYEALGEDGANQVVARAMRELNARLVELQHHAESDDLAALTRTARMLVKVAEQIGMMTFTCVAADVIAATEAGNSAARAATLARLQRIGDRSLNAVWKLREMMV